MHTAAPHPGRACAHQHLRPARPPRLAGAARRHPASIRWAAPWLLATLLLAWAALLPAAAQSRGVALVIGNSAYAERPLPNTSNDAADMAATLREARFEVLLRHNASESAMKEAIADFEDRLRANGGVGIFYFAGHGMQSNRGRNYLLPVGRSWQRERDVELFGVAADAVLAGMEKAGNRLNIVILDACRDTPLPSDSRSSISRGLARMDAPSGSVIAFATAPGRTASDNPGQRNGLYTQHLLSALRTPGLRLEDVFKVVGQAVEKDSGGQQSPEEFMKLRDLKPFCFVDGSGCGNAWQMAQQPATAAPATNPAPQAPSNAQVPAANPAPPAQTVAIARPNPAPVMQKVIFAADTFHALRSAQLGDEFKHKLDDLVGKMSGVTLEVVIAVGHTSAEEGTAEAMQRLSLARADAVKGYLASRGIEKNRIYVEGKGASQPAADNNSADGRAKNRRVEIEVVGTRRVP